MATKKGGEWKMEIAHGQIYFYGFFTGRNQKVKEGEHVHCRCAQLVHCHLHGILCQKGSWGEPQGLCQLHGQLLVKACHLNSCSLFLPCCLWIEWGMETALFSHTGRSHILSWGQKTALIMQVSGASAGGSVTGFGKEATLRLRPVGHCCSGVGGLGPELALVMPGHEQRVFCS